MIPSYKTSRTYPPNFEDIVKAFPGVKGRAGVIFTYGSTIYVPKGDPLEGDLVAHELVHTGQQGDDPKAWWDRYLTDRQFRLAQEVEAYRVQIDYAKKYYGRKKAEALAKHCVKAIASPIYGNMISLDEARRLLG